MPDLCERVAGCILGGAIGDAMGGPFENQPGPVNPYSEGDWRLSDDTQMTLSTCEAIVDAGTIDPERIAAAFLDWHRADRIRGIGASTFHALDGLAAGAHWALAGRKGEMSAGNGAAMRVAPLAFCCDPSDPSDRRLIRDVCRITHHNEEAYAGALAVILAIRHLPSGSTSRMTASVAEELPDCLVRDRLLAIADLPDSTEIATVADRFGCTGFVVHTVPLAIFAAQRQSSMTFEEVLAAIVSVGGDTDTNAAIAGQILGSSVGASGLPEHLVKRLPGREELRHMAERFARWVERTVVP